MVLKVKYFNVANSVVFNFQHEVSVVIISHHQVSVSYTILIIMTFLCLHTRQILFIWGHVQLNSTRPWGIIVYTSMDIYNVAVGPYILHRFMPFSEQQSYFDNMVL